MPWVPLSWAHFPLEQSLYSQPCLGITSLAVIDSNLEFWTSTLLVFPTASWPGYECSWRETSQPWLCNLHLVFILTDTHMRDQFLTPNWIFMLCELAVLLSPLELVRHLGITCSCTFALPLSPHTEKHYWYFICPKARAWGLPHSLSSSLNRLTRQEHARNSHQFSFG